MKKISCTKVFDLFLSLTERYPHKFEFSLPPNSKEKRPTFCFVWLINKIYWHYAIHLKKWGRFILNFEWVSLSGNKCKFILFTICACVCGFKRKYFILVTQKSYSEEVQFINNFRWMFKDLEIKWYFKNIHKLLIYESQWERVWCIL